MDSRLLAVRRVTSENKEKKTLGLNSKLYLSPQEKMKLIKSLKLDGKAKPIKKVGIQKPGHTDQKQPLGIQIIEDRVKQALCSLALEPEWEAKFEPDSYGFRPGRSCQDAIEAVFASLANKRQNTQYRKFLLKVDLKKCYNRINHKLLLNKLDSHSMIQNQVKAWLKADLLKSPLQNKTLSQNEMVTQQAAILSPLLSNIALHGLLDHLKEWVSTIPTKDSRKSAKQSALKVIRYADDIIVIHRDQRTIQHAKQEIETWLWKNCRLKLNQEKTKMINSTQGFHFLGFSFITISKNGKDRIKIYPSREEQARILLNLREVIKRNKSVSASQLIMQLRPKIIGWGNYYRYSECKEIFSKISHYISQKLRAWSFRIDKRHGRQKVKEKYFPSGKTYYFDNTKYQDNWVLDGKEKDKNEIKESFLPRLNWIKSKKWVKVKGWQSPYDGDHSYWATRLSSYKRLQTCVSKLLQRQNPFYPICQFKCFLDSVPEVE
jgi:RNA-directed DNA polymerase